MTETPYSISVRLNALMAESGLDPLSPVLGKQFEEYHSLLIRWNARVNLTAIRDGEGILSRHFVESIACARALPAGITTLLDYGSGAGFPGIPIALCRPEISVTLAESNGKKAAFLHEAVRILGISAAIHSLRAELLFTGFDCVALRAVDRMEEAVRSASRLVASKGWLALMSTSPEVEALRAAAGPKFTWGASIRLPGSEGRILALGAECEGPSSN